MLPSSFWLLQLKESPDWSLGPSVTWEALQTPHSLWLPPGSGTNLIGHALSHICKWVGHCACKGQTHGRGSSCFVHI